MDEEPLRGNVTSGVVRIGETIRKPIGPWTDAVDALLIYLESAGFDGAPRCLGRDDQGRQVLEYIDGDAGTPSPHYTVVELGQIGRLLRDFHDTAAGFRTPPTANWQQVIPPDREEQICHNDPAPWNIVKASNRWVLVDWDFAGPGSRLWDLAYTAQTAAPLEPHRPIAASVIRLRAIVDGYDLDEANRRDLAGVLVRRPRAMHRMLQEASNEGREPWTRIFAEDGTYWQDTARYLDEHLTAWKNALL